MLSRLAFLLTGLLLVALLLGLAGRYHLKQAVIENQASLVALVVKDHPEAEADLIEQIQHPDQGAISKGKELLSKYGIDSGNRQLETPLMRAFFNYTMIACLLLLLLTGGLFALVIGRFLQGQYGQIRGITRYTGEIGRGNYALDIRDNREGDLSILKNEIYKITTRLKEQAGILRKEKSLLADSLADISHQLKTPLTSLFVLSDLLSENPEEDKKTLFLEQMRSQLKRIEWLVGSLLKLSKLDAGAVIMKQENIPVSKLVKKALESLSIPAEIKALHIQIEGEEDVDFTGDFHWSHEALINILRNCIEHSPEQGLLKIQFQKNLLHTLIRVTDCGAGIAKEDLPHIFTRFYKGKNAAPDQVGIGLAMAKAIVEKQGGDITAMSEQGRGTEFTIKFYNGRENV